MQKDFLDNIMKIGDKVVFTAPGYRHLVKATVISFTPKKVRVEFINDWNFSKGVVETFLLDPNCVIKI